jgi:hypothetical protein
MRVIHVFIISVFIVATSCIGGVNRAAKILRVTNNASKLKRGSKYIPLTEEQIAKRKLYHDRALAGEAANKMTKKEDDKKHTK